MNKDQTSSIIPRVTDVSFNPAESIITNTDDTAAGSTGPSSGDQVVVPTQDDSSKPDAVVNIQPPQVAPSFPAISAFIPTAADLPHIILLKTAFTTAVANPDFVKDVKKVEKITATLTQVDPEVRVRAQLETNAYKTLRAKAAQVAEEPGGVYVAPTQAAIDKYIEDGLKVWRDKQK